MQAVLDAATAYQAPQAMLDTSTIHRYTQELRQDKLPTQLPTSAEEFVIKRKSLDQSIDESNVDQAGSITSCQAT